MASNYPPGVTGSEWQIAGPTVEEEQEATYQRLRSLFEAMKDMERELTLTAEEVGETDDVLGLAADALQCVRAEYWPQLHALQRARERH